MKNKGFTLIELIAVITILSLVAIIAVPRVLQSVFESKEKSYVAQTETITNAAKKWSIANTGVISEEHDYYLSIDTLVEANYLNDKDIIDPRDHSKMDGCIVIHYDNAYSQFDFTYSENNCFQLSQ